MYAIKITQSDNFVFALLELDEAKNVLNENKATVFKIYDDDTESEVIRESEIVENSSFEFGVCLGFHSRLKSDYQNAIAKDNETQNFDTWLQSRIISLIE